MCCGPKHHLKELFRTLFLFLFFSCFFFSYNLKSEGLDPIQNEGINEYKFQ